MGDVFESIRNAASACYGAILLDVDHSPTSLVQPKNGRLYDRSGFRLISRTLKADGKVAFWSASEEPGVSCETSFPPASKQRASL